MVSMSEVQCGKDSSGAMSQGWGEPLEGGESKKMCSFLEPPESSGALLTP